MKYLELYGLNEYADRRSAILDNAMSKYVVWVESFGGKVINLNRPLYEWKIQFMNDEDAVAFALKYKK